MKIASAFPSKYISAQTLDGAEPIVEIAGVVLEDVADDGQGRPVVYFKNKTAGWVLNRTNAGTLSELFGPETDLWTGRKIQLFSVSTHFQGRAVLGLRVREAPPRPVPAAPPPPPPRSQFVDDLDDDSIPF